MIAIVSSSHFPDDERIFYKQICSLLDIGKKITYFTKSIVNRNLSKKGLTHINYDEKMSINDFINKVVIEIFNQKDFHVHNETIESILNKNNKDITYICTH